ncbi:Reverse transcriptase (RNA-dependent DNA polymerase) [Popillia japonica]|uniref:Reverse transcriptase (RNA-dependent DNA polymerase) n=1 Tax=Popillia japonica TaxID=7064 RepID=A0AAW1K2N1_POPJA
MVKLLLGQLSGYPPDGWDRRVKARHWITRSWPLRDVLVQEEYNVLNEPLWKFQINAYMKARNLTDNIEGNVPAADAGHDKKCLYEQNEGKAMNAIIRSLDSERANLVLTCITAKEMIEKLASVFEKNSECSQKKNLPNKSDNNDKNKSAVSWCSVVRYHKTENNETDFWYADSGASSHMTYHREWFSEYHEYTDKCFVEIADRKHLEIVGVVAASDAKEIEEVISYLQHHFEVKALDAKCFLGLQIEQSCDGSISICQEAYAKKVLKRFNMSECATVSTPADCNQNLGDYASDADCNQNLGDYASDGQDTSFPYSEAVGALMYLAIGTRPDISYAVGVVSRHLEKPGYVFHLGSGVVSWASKRQQSVSTSSTESEYIAGCQAVKELVWLKCLVTDLTSRALEVKFYMDNQSAIRLVKNPVFHKNTKHIDPIQSINIVFANEADELQILKKEQKQYLD